jgi:hypothetical protein|tara:strand:+ start:2153 stop:2521 length:369 start_codon:yes stop_codon:yes gene_type:complete
MKVSITNGELLDRISILELKKLNMKNAANLAAVEKEFLELNRLVVEVFSQNDSTLQVLFLELARINGKLWELENLVRKPEVSNKEFISYSKTIFKYNGIRNDLKNDINLVTGSDNLHPKEYE